ncbi:unnamed protein product [Nyctereutes procyonoides]|uniref:(raccoon dog) hypothetical protein n=1 Tax=Nyctereutes procyonoides TaxID=34880 RepID=A0A811YSS9_NYCPR|nr:unnamed protein product [Nyctereutes procyonoides]
MPVDMKSQGSFGNEENYDPNYEKEEDEDLGGHSRLLHGIPIHFLTYKEFEGTLKEPITSLASHIFSMALVSHLVAKLILVNFHGQLLIEAQVHPPPSQHYVVRMQFVQKENVLSLAYQHQFCHSFWEQHHSDCPLQTPESFVFPLLPDEELRDKHRDYLFRDYMENHYQIQLCSDADCPPDYSDYAIIWKWLTKCAGNSEIADSITAHAKDCPKCSIVTKNKGCSHMQCSKCKHDFSQICLGDWKTHGSKYYECSWYKVKNYLGTWNDLQYLQSTVKLLTKKKLLEYQQVQLEAEIENLSWKVELIQMHIAEQWRKTAEGFP